MPDMTVDEFMNRIAGIESAGASDPWSVQNSRTQAHGKWQIMPSNWSPWAREAGLPGNAARSAENQTRVARHKMQEYRNNYGSWEAAAIAWFAGPDRARRYNAGDMSVLNFSDGNMTVGEYVNRISQGGGGAAPPSAEQRQSPDFSTFGAVGADSMLGDNQLEPPRNENVRDLWGHMVQSMSNQVRSGRGEEAAPAWVAPQPDNPISPGVEGDPNEPGDLGLPSDGNVQVSGSGPAQEFLSIASQFIGTPYVWGGADPSGFDCSGIIQYAARQMGVTVPRVSRDQARAGREVSLGQAQPGDLIAFPARGLEVGHIGILTGRDANGNWQMLHAPRSGQNVQISAVGSRQVATVRRIFDHDGAAPGSQQQMPGAPQAPSPQPARSTQPSTRPSDVPRTRTGPQ